MQIDVSAPRISLSFQLLGTSGCQHIQLATYTLSPSHACVLLVQQTPSQWIKPPLPFFKQARSEDPVLSPLTAKDAKGKHTGHCSLTHYNLLICSCSFSSFICGRCPSATFQWPSSHICCRSGSKGFWPLKPQASFQNFHLRSILYY